MLLLFIYRVKPAIFDLFLAFAIGAYAFSWYLSVLVSVNPVDEYTLRCLLIASIKFSYISWKGPKH